MDLRNMKKPIKPFSGIANLMNDPEKGTLKVSLFVFLNQKYSFTKTPIDQIIKDAYNVYRTDEVIPLVIFWRYSLC